MKNISGKTIRYLRNERGFSQRDLVRECELLGYPASQNMISRIENGKRRVTDFEVIIFMKIFRVTSMVLLDESMVTSSHFVHVL